MIDNVSGSGSSAPQSVLSSAPGGKLGKEEFLKLFMAQVKNQDPLKPMEADQLATQLAQFSSVEQLMNINEQLGAQAGMNSDLLAALSGANAVGSLGKMVIAYGNQVEVPDQTEVTFRSAGAGTATLTILDETGNVVGSRDLGSVQAGRQTVDLGSAAKGLAAGTYRYEISVQDAERGAVKVDPYTTGRVDGVRNGPGGPVFILGDREVPLISVVEIYN